MSEPDWEVLREAARRATAGPWTATQDMAERWHVDACFQGGESDYIPVADINQGQADAEFIALASPATVLVLLGGEPDDTRDSLRAECAKLEGMAEVLELILKHRMTVTYGHDCRGCGEWHAECGDLRAEFPALSQAVRALAARLDDA